jgi:hypothetical protein
MNTKRKPNQVYTDLEHEAAKKKKPQKPFEMPKYSDIYKA